MPTLRYHTLTLGNILRFFGVAVIICSLIWYVHFQARNVLTGPSIILDDTHGVVHHEQRLILTGTAQNIVRLMVNGKEIYTNETGMFAHPLILENGYTIVTITAYDRFGRTTSLNREFVYVPV